MKSKNILLIIALGAGAYYLYSKTKPIYDTSSTIGGVGSAIGGVIDNLKQAVEKTIPSKNATASALGSAAGSAITYMPKAGNYGTPQYVSSIADYLNVATGNTGLITTSSFTSGQTALQYAMDKPLAQQQALQNALTQVGIKTGAYMSSATFSASSNSYQPSGVIYPSASFGTSKSVAPTASASISTSELISRMARGIQ